MARCQGYSLKPNTMATLLPCRRGAIVTRSASRKTAVRVQAVASDVKASTTPGPWAPNSWRKFPVVQQPEYPNQEAYKATLEQISAFPPLIFGERTLGPCRCERGLL